MARVFMIGWDGATFDLIRPWVAQGKLPTFARLMREGAHGSLRSTLPPMTYPAWSSFLTGVNQGKHGIFDFTRQKPGTYTLEFVSGAQRRAPTIWRILSDAGQRVISISLPCTFPPEPVNGIMISGLDAPGTGVYMNAQGMYPPELHAELATNSVAHPICGLAAAAPKLSQGKDDEALEIVLQAVRDRAATAKYLLTTKPWDCAMILFGESDGVCHQYWKYCDPKSPRFQDSPSGLQDSILRVYEELDRQTEELLRLTPPETTFLMMSDHGFGGVTNWVLYPNCWLQQQGLLRFRGGFSQWRSRMVEKLGQHVMFRLPARLKRVLFRLGQRGMGFMAAQMRYSLLDWSGTQAYFEENPYYPVLRINLKGREPQGVVEPGRAYEELRDRLIQSLEAWRHPETNEPIVEKAYRREELYKGPSLDEFPDIVAKWGQHKGYTYAFALSSRSHDRAWIRQVDTTKSQKLEALMGKSGHHRDDGILLAHGPNVRQGATVEGARLIDLAPTILRLLGVEVPADMDGRVLEELFTHGQPAQVAKHEVSPPQPPGGADKGEGSYTAEDEEKIAERLRALGYL